MESLAQQIENLGYVVIKKLLSNEEVEEYKRKIEKAAEKSLKTYDPKTSRIGGWTLGDGVTQLPDFWPLIFHGRLIGAIKETLGPNVVYTQHSDLHLHKGGVGWHRDCAYREFGVGPDWDESRDKYKIVRVAIYLQSYAESGFALGVIPGSHRYPYKLFTLAMKACNVIDHKILNKITKRRDLLLPPPVGAKPMWIRTEPGDCIIFDQRLLHSGSRIHGPKYAIYLSYGVDNEHSRRHRKYYLHERKDLDYKDFHSDLAKKLREENLLLEV